MISIVIPIFNEAENVDILYTRIAASASAWNDDFELILVDDGSSDASRSLILDLCRKDARVKLVALSRNFGHQAAITAGIEKSDGDAVIIMDGDLQDPPEELHRFLAKWREGYEVVYAIRTKRKENIFKRAAYAIFYRLLKMISDISIPLDSGDFCVMDRKVVDVMVQQMPEKNRFVRGLRAFAGFRQVGISYERAERAAGEVKYTFRKLVGLALDGLLDFSTFPLRMASYLGLFIALASLATGGALVVMRLFHLTFFGYSVEKTPGIATLAVGVFFLGGMTIVILGIIGEYVGRIYFEVKKRPFYIIDDSVTSLWPNSTTNKADV